MVFGKNYDKEIINLKEQVGNLIDSNNLNVKEINKLLKLFESIQDSVLDIAKVQAQYKQFIKFFINHGTVDADAQEDLIKMIQEMSEINEIAKKGKKNETRKR